MFISVVLELICIILKIKITFYNAIDRITKKFIQLFKSIFTRYKYNSDNVDIDVFVKNKEDYFKALKSP